MTDKTTDRADLLGACMMEEVRHCDPIRAAWEAMNEDFGVYCAVGDLIGSGIDNAYTTIVEERAAPVEDFGRLFRGTLTQASVYPREVVKIALAHNAAAVILYHNHPSSNVTPSVADEMLTKTLKEALALIDVRVIDHFVVGGMTAPFSFAERGLL